MEIRAISRAQFDEFKPYRHAEAEGLFEETDWFVDEAGVVIGLVAREQADDDWSFVILGRDQHGTFRAFENDAGIAGRDAARERLIAAMEQTLASGRWKGWDR
jgi:hypothetical protein